MGEAEVGATSKVEAEATSADVVINRTQTSRTITDMEAVRKDLGKTFTAIGPSSQHINRTHVSIYRGTMDYRRYHLAPT